MVGVDLAPSLLDKARELAADLPAIRFEELDARSLPFADSSFDVAVFDSTLSHVPEPDRRARRGLPRAPSRRLLAAFDGDYATTTVALDDHDSLQVCVDAMLANS